MSKKKMLLVGDYVFKTAELTAAFNDLTQYGIELLTFQDESVRTPEQYQEEMLRLEQQGPEASTPLQELIEAIKVKQEPEKSTFVSFYNNINHSMITTTYICDICDH